MTNSSHHRLVALTIVGGFLDGQTFEFADGLNCIIGARGTGKTTVLEFTRWVMDALPEDESCRNRIERLIEQNLDGGRVDLKVRTKDDRAYTISRSVGEDSIVCDAKGDPTQITVTNGGLFRVDVFSQNEVEEIADRTTSQLDLIDTFQAEEIGTLNEDVEELRRDLATNAGVITPIQQRIAALAEQIKGLPTVTEKLKAFGTEGGQDSGAINKAQEAKALRGREVMAAKAALQAIDEVGIALKDQVGALAERAGKLFTAEMISGSNADQITNMRNTLERCCAAIDQRVQEALVRLRQERQSLSSESTKLALAHKVQEQAYQQLLEKHKEIQGKAHERAKLEKERNELLAKQRQHQELSTKVGKLLGEREAVKQRLSETRDMRFAMRERIVKEINAALRPSIRVSLEQYGSPIEYRQWLEERLSGTGIKWNLVIPKLLGHFSPSDLAGVVLSGDPMPLVDQGGLNTSQATKVIDCLRMDGHIYALDGVELLDLPRIELKDNETYKSTKALSTGQKCTTILPILLLDSDSPLLIDQPEDNLDNRFVYDTVVQSIKKAKPNRQLIFVTHNPNIPVLGEADRVFVLESNGVAASKRMQGDVDECKDDIVTLLEGGEDAFIERKKRYRY